MVTLTIFLLIVVTSFGTIHTLDFDLVESIPLNTTLITKKTTFDSWMDLITHAKESLYFAQFYLRFTEGKNFPNAGGQLGVTIFQEIINAAKRGVVIKMVVQKPSRDITNEDAIYLADHGYAEVRFIDWEAILGNGILHTKMIIADNTSFYLGSANTGWDALTQVKEMGIVIKNNPDLAIDAYKVFSTYWLAAYAQKLPSTWPANLYATFNKSTPQQIIPNNYVYLSVSPPPFVVPKRADDLETILSAVNNAKKYVCIEVMDYFPGTLYYKQNFFWPVIDDALKSAAFRGVKIRFLVSKWKYSNSKMFQYLRSLNAIENIEVRLFEIEEWVPPIPFTRVNHAKFLVTETQAFISTSNWSGDYFLSTGGVSVNWIGTDVVNSLQVYFERDWSSDYSKELR